MDAFSCFRVDYWNSLLASLPKQRLSPSIGLRFFCKAHCPTRIFAYSLISSFYTHMIEVLLWLPITARIHYKILFLASDTQFQGSAPDIFLTIMRKPSSATSSRSLHSADRLSYFHGTMFVLVHQAGACHCGWQWVSQLVITLLLLNSSTNHWVLSIGLSLLKGVSFPPEIRAQSDSEYDSVIGAISLYKSRDLIY